MVSVYLELRKDAVNKRGEHAIRSVITSSGATPIRKNTGFSVQEKHWDAQKQRIKPTHPQAVPYNHALDALVNERRTVAANLVAAGKRARGKSVEIMAHLGGSFESIGGYYETKFRNEGKIGTADRYKSLIKTITDLFPKLQADDMDNDWADTYRQELKRKKMEHNTILTKLKAVKAILNKAEKDGLITVNRMSKYTIGTFRKGDKEALEPEEIEMLWNYEPRGGWERYARLTFLFSFYATGARFKDVLTLRKSSLKLTGGTLRLRWQPSKTKDNTGEWVDIRVNERLAKIIEEAENDSPTFFGLIDVERFDKPQRPTRGKEDEIAELVERAEQLDAEIDRAQTKIGRALKMIMLRAGIGKDISFHCARHTFAQLANRVTGRDIYTIKGALGHGDIKTTQDYLGKDLQAIDEAIAKVYGG